MIGGPRAEPMQRVIVIGASGHARVVADVLEKAGKYEVIGLLDASAPAGSARFGYPVLGDDNDLPRVVERHGIVGGVVGVGDNWIRRLIHDRLLTLLPGFRFVSAIHPAAVLGSGVIVGEGSVVVAGAVINPGSVIGSGCIVNTGASVDHDSMMEDFSSLAPRAVTGGQVRVGTGAAVGIGATLIHGITIGEHAVVGAGSTVLRDVPALVVAYGSPARVVRAREAGDRYL